MVDVPQLSSLPAVVAAVVVVTLGTVIMPGPTLFAASHFGVARGARSAARFLAAVMVVNVAVFGLLAFGFQPLLARVGAVPWLLPAGGLALVFIGVVMALGARIGSRVAGGGGAVRTVSRLDNPCLAGVAVPLANPGFWLWWSTVGATFVHLAAAWGRPGLAVVFTAYLLSVCSWYLLFVVGLARGRRVLPLGAMPAIQMALGVVMAGLGLVVVLRHLHL